MSTVFSSAETFSEVVTGSIHRTRRVYAALNSIIERTGAAIVVSSCWRVGRTLPDLRELLNGWGVKNAVVIDRTGAMQPQRGLEIGDWILSRIHDRGDVDEFVILDDDADMGGLLRHLVRSDFNTGLTPALANRAVEILSGRFRADTTASST